MEINKLTLKQTLPWQKANEWKNEAPATYNSYSHLKRNQHSMTTTSDKPSGMKQEKQTTNQTCKRKYARHNYLEK